ncbi:erp-44.2, partial [Pristionchus pacificus]
FINCSMNSVIVVSLLLSLWVTTIDAEAKYLSMDNHEQIINDHQVVFVAFCADWCPFSRRLKPIFEEAGKKFKEDHPESSAVFGIVDSQAHPALNDKYFVNKYPTMKVFVNGELVTKEYRSTRSVEALTDFVKQQLQTAMHEFSSEEQLMSNLDRSKRNIIARFADSSSVGYTNLKKMSSILKEECQFFIGKSSSDSIVFFDPDTKDEQRFTGDVSNYDFLKQWLTDKCIPLVREVTFENVEELTEEGLPFLIYFRDTDKKEDDKIFIDQVVRELGDQKASVNALLADGKKFAHPLRHLGKTAKDLPVLAIDSFQHMFMFPDMNQLTTPGKLRQFIMDLHSGKLHKEFHETMDQKMIDLAKFNAENPEGHDHGTAKDGEARPPSVKPGHTSPPPSVFKELKPSNKRYSLLQKSEL